MRYRILVTGATGFTGRFLCMELLHRNIHFTCLVRPGSNREWLDVQNIPCIEGDLSDRESLHLVFSGFNVLLNVASLGFGNAPNIVSACQVNQFERSVFVSTTALFTNLNAATKLVRRAAEDCIFNSGLNYTVLRPTMIYGTPADRNMVRLIKLIQCSPVIPVFGNGCALQQPVHVADVAWAICEVLNHPKTIGQAYNISGGQVLNYNQVIGTVASTLGRNPRLLHLPATPLVWMLSTLQQLRIPFPIKGEQILRLNEDKSFVHEAASRDFGYQPRTFIDGIRDEIEILEIGLMFPDKSACPSSF
jgi:nucleoside-diphosphate-sugar epimerase